MFHTASEHRGTNSKIRLIKMHFEAHLNKLEWEIIFFLFF